MDRWPGAQCGPPPGQGAFVVTYEQGRLLYWQAPGDSERLYAESPTHLFVLSHQLDIILDAPGAATGHIVSGQLSQPFERALQVDTAGQQ